MNNLNTKVDDSDVNDLKAVPIGWKELSDLVDNGIVKNTKFSTLKTKITKLEQKILDPNTLIRINQHNSDKQNLERKNGDVDQEIPNIFMLKIMFLVGNQTEYFILNLNQYILLSCIT